MKCPVIFDRPLIPLVQIDVNMLPFVPNNIVTGEHTSNYIRSITAQVINECIAKAKITVARMFCLNLLSRNNWYNEDFINAVQFVTDLIELRISKRQFRDIYSCLQKLTEDALSLIVSEYIIIYPELKSYLNNEAHQIAYVNAGSFNQIKQEIAGMYGNHQHQIPVHTRAGIQMQHVNQNMQMNQNMGYQQPMNNDVIPIPNGYIPVQDPRTGQIMLVNQFANRPQQQQNLEYTRDYTHRSRENFRSIDTPRHQNYHEPDDGYRNRPERAIPTPQIRNERDQKVSLKDDIETELSVVWGSEMDRNKHRIALVGNIVRSNIDTRHENYMNKVSEEIGKAAINSDNEEVIKLDVALNINESIETIRMNMTKTSQNILKRHVVTSNVFSTNRDVSQFSTALKGRDNFIRLAEYIKEMSTSLEDDDETLNMFIEINNFLTNLVNEFLSCNLNIKDYIESFVDDISDLNEHLRNKYGVRTANALTYFENVLIKNISNDLNDENIDSALDAVVSSVKESTINCIVLPSLHTLVFVPMTAAELGYEVKDKPLQINPITAPILNDLAFSVFSSNESLEVQPLSNIIITEDNVRYVIYKNPSLNNIFMIKKY